MTCPYAKAGDQLSLDNTVSDGEGNEKSWLDDMPDESAAIAELMEDAELLRALYAKLNELDPEGRLICQLIMEGKSERDCGKEMGLSRNTFEAAIEAAYREGEAKLKGNGKSVPALSVLKTPLRDGDLERPDDPAYAGSYFVNANATSAPGIVDADRNPILTRSEVYSGVYGRASISFYAFNSSGNKGIACGLNNLQKIRDGEPLGGKASAESDFATDDDDDFLD